MEKPVPETTESTNREVLLDFVKEVTGYEHGLGRTIIDLRKQPDTVLQSYLNRERKYISPFRLLFASLSLWLFVNSFVIDWYAIWYKFIKQYVDFLTTNFIQVPLEKKAVFAEKMEIMMRTYSTFGGDIFSKYYVPFIILVLPLAAWFGTRFCRQFNVSYRSILIADTYAMAANSILFFFVSVGFALIPWITLVVIFIMLAVTMAGRNMLMLVPLRKFYQSHGPEIEKKILRANMVAVIIIMIVIAVGYFVVAYFL